MKKVIKKNQRKCKITKLIRKPLGQTQICLKVLILEFCPPFFKANSSQRQQITSKSTALNPPSSLLPFPLIKNPILI